MEGKRANQIIAGGIALVNAIIPFAVLMDWIHMTAEQVAGAMGVVGLAGTFVGLLFAQSPITNTPEAKPVVREAGESLVVVIIVCFFLLVVLLVLLNRI